MKDEIKEILDNFKCYEERYKKCNETQFIIIYRDIHLLLDYITNLQKENKILKEKINKVRECIGYEDYVDTFDLINILECKDVKEIPQFEGSLEQLDKLNIRGESNETN